MEGLRQGIAGARNLLVEMFRLSIGELENALEAIKNGGSLEAESHLDDDKELDSLYEETEKVCFKILLLEAPFAGDFRKVSAILKMITDLERIGDYSIDILEECIAAKKALGSYCPSLITLGDYVKESLQRALLFFLNDNVSGARSLPEEDDKIDSLYASIRAMANDPNSLKGEEAVVAALVAKYLERIGDHVVNLGEWTDYGLTGTHSLS